MTKSITGNMQAAKRTSAVQAGNVGASAKKTAKANAQSKAKSKGKKKSSASWGVKHVLATFYAPTFPPTTEPLPGVPDAIEALRHAYVQLTRDGENATTQTDIETQEQTANDKENLNSDVPGAMADPPITDEHKIAQTKAENTEVLTDDTLAKRSFRPSRRVERPSRAKRYGLLAGVNEVTRALERRSVSVVAVARDVGTSILISHLPALCAASGALMVPIPDDGRKLGAAMGLGRASVVAIVKDNNAGPSDEGNKPLPAPLKHLTHVWSQLASPLNFPWLPSLNKPNGDQNTKGAQLTFQQPVLIPHRNKVKREVLGVPEEDDTN